MANNTHLKYMKLAFREAEKARGTCSPNPFVGAVIVKQDQVIAKGHTQQYGSDHAEVDALAKAGEKARGADIYVTLEPCSHYGKTPPCTEAIIKAGIKRVFFGMRDPNPLIKGDGSFDDPSPGMLSLRNAGIEVHEGLIHDEIAIQLESFLCRIHKRRPFVTWKTALSLDGKYAANDGSARWISNALSRKMTHRLREQSDIVLTGIGTLLCDDPQLNVRLPKPKRQPLIALLDPFLDIPLSAKVLNDTMSNPLLIYYSQNGADESRIIGLKALGAQLIPVPGNKEKLDLNAILEHLYQLGKNSVLLECGSKLASSFFALRLVDKCHIFYGNKLIGGGRSILSELPLPNIKDAIGLDIISVRRLDSDIHVSAYPIFS
ncbi:MAG: bifunctional diaminohydroxyphosphoribosylaminopyrimidine deaminase/5-amino-6-(5-phosphoribosylamino)uracil reductase RibD [Candidatus Cloacimonadaceae bacterium]|nr:bifunctional diaminohydroxyphosphoribosylaminopyrimidine deaminase/5-amino-6-(5-phosphoribosylamino)uracil reductase RibD [Candidatus Cloacimonadaceae bacterium]